MANPAETTVASIMQHEHFRAARLVAGKDGVQRPVRWIHVLEVARPDRLLNGHELILTSGIGLGHESEMQTAFLQQLIDQQAAALCIVLGWHFESVPEAMLRLADQAAFPLIIFPMPVRFVDLMHDLNAQFIERRYQTAINLEAFSWALSQRLRDIDGVRGALSTLQSFVNADVAYLPVDGEPIILSAPGRGERITLSDWPRWGPRPGAPISPDAPELTTVNGAQVAHVSIVVLGQQRAELSIVVHDRMFTDFDLLALRRCAEAITQDHLSALYAEERRRQTQTASLLDWLEDRAPMERVLAPLRAAQPALRLDRLRVCVAQPTVSSALLPALDTSAVRWAMLARPIFEASGFSMLATFDSTRMIFVLLDQRGGNTNKSRAHNSLQEVMHRLHLAQMDDSALFLAAGRMVTSPNDIRRSFATALEAVHVQQKTGIRTFLYEDLQMYRVLSVLEQQGVLQEFISDYLAPVLTYDAEHQSEMLRTLKSLLDSNGAKRTAAAQLYITRQTLYQRMRKLEELLGSDYTDPLRRYTLALALYAHEYSKAAAFPTC